MNATLIPSRPRSTLVSVFGWVMLVIGCFGTLCSVLLMGLAMVALEQGGEELFPADQMAELPATMLLVLDNLNLILTLTIVSFLLMAVAGFGVIRRRDWGRLLAMILLALSIITAPAGPVLSYLGMSGEQVSANNVLPPLLVLLYNIGLAVLTVVLHGWLLWKLRTIEIRGEFVETPTEST